MIFSLDKALICFILSMLSLLYVPDFALLSWTSGLCLVSSILVVFCISYIKNQRRIMFSLIYLLFFCFGLIFSHQSAKHLLQQADNIANLSKKIQTDIVVLEILNQQEYQSLIASVKLDKNLPTQKIYIQWRLSDKVQLGERWQAQLNIRPISSRLNFSGFDKQQWLLAKGITAWASVKEAVKISEDFSWRERKLKQAFQSTAELPMQGLLMALGFGERAWLKTEHWKAYQQTNTAHLIAISGLHIGLAMALGFYLTRGVQFFLATHKITPKLPILVGLGFAWFYAELAGFAIPIFRAMIALIIVYLFRLLRFYHSPWQLLLRVVAILLICDPMMLLSNSFWLSLGAVMALILHYQYFPFAMLHWRGQSLSDTFWHKFRYILALLHLQLGLLLFFTPVNLFIFNGLSLNSLWANFLIVPIFSLILVPVVLFAIITNGAFHSWQIANDISQYCTEFMVYLQNRWISISLTQSYFICALLCFIFLMLLVYLNRKIFPKDSQLNLNFIQKPKGFHFFLPQQVKHLTKTYVVTFLLGVACLSFGIIRYWGIHKHNTWQLETLDVGQGLATLIVKEGRGILYDTGSSWRGGSMAEIEILPYLQREGIALDKLILSHDDNDHAGGVNVILQQYPQVEFIQASTKNYQKTQRTFCQKGLSWQWQGLHFTVLAPKKIVERANNTDSCVILVSDGQYKVLLTGDADLATEREILPDLGNIDVLQVGHHGSKTSTGDAMLQKTQPTISLISSGRWNPWKFPHQVVINRLEKIHSQIYNSANSGQIKLVFSPESIEILTARSLFSPWYRRLIGSTPK